MSFIYLFYFYRFYDTNSLKPISKLIFPGSVVCLGESYVQQWIAIDYWWWWLRDQMLEKLKWENATWHPTFISLYRQQTATTGIGVSTLLPTTLMPFVQGSTSVITSRWRKRRKVSLVSQSDGMFLAA